MKKEGLSSSSHPIEILRSVYLDRKRNNSRYSLSAFARHLGISVSFLSRLLNGERSLTVNQVVQIGTVLGLDSDQIEQAVATLVQHADARSKISKKFVAAVRQRESSRAPTKSALINYLEIDQFKSMSEWYHLAILNLTLTRGFDSRSSHIARRLGISRVEAEGAIIRLIELGLLKWVDGKLKRTVLPFFVKTDRSEKAIREFTVQTLDLAKTVLEDSSTEAYQARCMPGTTLPIRLKTLPALKERIRKFQLELLELSKSDSYDEVYQLNLHLFPVSHSEPRRNK